MLSWQWLNAQCLPPALADPLSTLLLPSVFHDILTHMESSKGPLYLPTSSWLQTMGHGLERLKIGGQGIHAPGSSLPKSPWTNGIPPKGEGGQFLPLKKPSLHSSLLSGPSNHTFIIPLGLKEEAECLLITSGTYTAPVALQIVPSCSGLNKGQRCAWSLKTLHL